MKITYLPNLLTVLRLVLVVPFVALFLVDTLPAKIAALVIFIVAALTDFVDGRLARKIKNVTDFGAFLDPLSDKALVNVCFLCLVSISAVPLWLFALILVRDFAVDGMRMMAARAKITIAASFAGKLKTMVQMWTLTLILLNRILQNSCLEVVTNTLLYIVLFLTLYSGMKYIIEGFRNPRIIKH